MSQYGLSLDSVRTAIAAASNGPKGAVEKDDKHWQVDANDQVAQGPRVRAAGDPLQR